MISKRGAATCRAPASSSFGQRIFFLHDGRTTDLLAAIQAHASPNSEANAVVQAFNSLGASDKQSILDFLRSL
jgi:CxxC motif-containing protein (DUF1111 family)